MTPSLTEAVARAFAAVLIAIALAPGGPPERPYEPRREGVYQPWSTGPCPAPKRGPNQSSGAHRSNRA